MSKPIDKAQDILTRRGAKLSQDDLFEMQNLFIMVPVSDWEEVARIMEGVATIVNDPSYEGNLEPIE